MSTDQPARKRLASLDQFRGYTVAGMFLVNFLGSFAACPTVLRHHHSYCSYADTIMPGFLFAVGFAFRLTFGRRAAEQGLSSAYFRVVRRFLGLVLFSIIFYGAGKPEETWQALTELSLMDILYKPMKREWYQTLMHIAVTALWITPVIRAGTKIRVLWMVGSAILHVFLSYQFNFIWCNSSPNAIDGGPLAFLTWSVPAILGTLACDAIIGSSGRPPLLKMLLWSVLVMALGWGMSFGSKLYEMTPEEVEQLQVEKAEQAEERAAIGEELKKLVEDLNAQRSERKKIVDSIETFKKKRLAEAVATLQSERGLTGFPSTALIDEAEESLKQAPIDDAELLELENELIVFDSQNTIEELKPQIKELKQKFDSFVDLKLATDPVIPSAERIERMKQRIADEGWGAIVANPPFVKPPEDDKRITFEPYRQHFRWNYWMMCQRAGTLSYLTFAGGLNLALYVIFYVFNDVIGLKFGVFRTFGVNALAGYIAHEMVGRAVKPFIPKDALDWYMWSGFAVFFLLTYMFIRHLEKHNIFLRL